MSTAIVTRPCRGCGAKLLFAADIDGKVHPLDLSAPVYRLDQDMLGVKHVIRIPDASDVTCYECGVRLGEKHVVVAWGTFCSTEPCATRYRHRLLGELEDDDAFKAERSSAPEELRKVSNG